MGKENFRVYVRRRAQAELSGVDRMQRPLPVCPQRERGAAIGANGSGSQRSVSARMRTAGNPVYPTSSNPRAVITLENDRGVTPSLQQCRPRIHGRFGIAP
jgi:hypothetical protein